MVSQKRMFVAAASALAATLALAGCSSDDYGLSSAESAAIGLPAVAAEEPAQESDEVAADEASAEAEAEADEADEVATQPVGKVTNKLIAKSVPKMGNVVTDAKGWVLYRFDKDKASPSKSNCVGDCAILWPPVLAGETLELSGLSASTVDTVERADGGLQVTIGGWPVYRYIGDKKPGTWKGQNVGSTWFVVQKDGKKNLTCLPKPSKPVPLPVDPAKSKAKDSAEESGVIAAPEDESDSAYDSTGGY